MSKVIRITSIFLLFFIIIFILGGIVLNFYFNKKLVSVMKERVAEATHNEYALSLDRISINLLTQSITVKNLIVAPSNRLPHLKAQYVFKAKVLKIIDFSILTFIRSHDLIIDRIEFEEPQISIFQGSERLPKKDLNKDDKFSIYAAFSKKINSLSIGHIDIMNSRFNIYKNGADTLSVFSTNDNSISIKNFNINSDSDAKNRLFTADKFEVVMNSFSYHLGNGLYTLYGKSMRASYLDSSLVADSLQLVPNFSKNEFADEAGRQISRVKIISSKVEFQKMDVKLFFEYNWLIIHKVQLSGCAIDLYRDNTHPLQHIIRPSVQRMIKGLPFYVSVDTIEMKDGNAVYQELNSDQVLAGKIAISKINGIITGVQNDTSSYNENSSISAKLSGYLLDKGRFTQTYKFPLTASKEFFYCTGTLTSMPMELFNPMIQHTKHLVIKKGQLDSVSYSFTAHENTSEGTMKFMYHDLEVEVMNKDGGKSGLQEKLKTFLANEILVKDSNPGKDGKVRVSAIHADHNPYRFFLYYSMQTILSGVAPAVAGEKNARMMKKKK